MCNNTIDRVAIYRLLRNRKMGHLEAKEAVTKRLSMWKSYEDMIAVSVPAIQRGDNGLLLTLDEADIEFGKEVKLPIAVRPTFAQMRKFHISVIAATQGPDDINKYILDRCHTQWRAEKWTESVFAELLASPVNLGRAITGRKPYPIIFRYHKEKMHGKSTYKLQNDQMGRMSAGLRSYLGGDIEEFRCFNSWEPIRSAEGDKREAEQKVKHYKALLGGDTVPVRTCRDCEGTSKALVVYELKEKLEVVEGRFGLEDRLHFYHEWTPTPSVEIFSVMGSGKQWKYIPCETCNGLGYFEDDQHPVMVSAREHQKKFGYAV
jgi:hypothetical protein